MFPLSSGWFSFPYIKNKNYKTFALIAKVTLYPTWSKSNFLLYSFLLLLPSHLLFLYLFRRREAAQVREYIFILVSFYMMINSFWSYTESSRPKLSWVMFNDRLWLCHWYIAPHRVELPGQGATSQWVYVQFHHWLSQWYIAPDVAQYSTLTLSHLMLLNTLSGRPKSPNAMSTTPWVYVQLSSLTLSHLMLLNALPRPPNSPNAMIITTPWVYVQLSSSTLSRLMLLPASPASQGVWRSPTWVHVQWSSLT